MIAGATVIQCLMSTSPSVYMHAAMSNKKNLKKVAIAMHCNLRLPEVASVVAGFNYEATLLRCINSTISQPPRTHNAP